MYFLTSALVFGHFDVLIDEITITIIILLTMAMGDVEIDYAKLCGELELQELEVVRRMRRFITSVGLDRIRAVTKRRRARP